MEHLLELYNPGLLNEIFKNIFYEWMDCVNILEKCDGDHWIQVSTGNHCPDLDIMTLIY